VGIADPKEDLLAAQLASESVVVGRAVTLARWIGSRSLPVTAGQVLRKADGQAAGAALGVDVPPKLRTMADIPALYRPWCVAVATGLLRIGDGRVTGGPAAEHWPPDEADLLAGWLAGLRAVCAAESRPKDEDGIRVLVIAVLTVLEGGASRASRLWEPVYATLEDLCRRYDKSCWELLYAAERYYDPEINTPVPWLLALLAEFGAIAGNTATPVINPLGRWAAEHLSIGLPGLADPGLSAADMIAEAAQFSEEKRAHVTSQWLAERQPAKAVLELLTAAEGMSPLLRCVAIGAAANLGQAGLPAWQDMATGRCVGPHVRAVLADWEQGAEPSDADWRWLDVEFAAVALETKGPDAALSSVWENMPGTDLDSRLAAVRAVGHPYATALAGAVAEFAASGAPRSIDQVAQLKVSLSGFRPPIWRRVQLPVTASLGYLHLVIQVLFGWDGDHLHAFQAGKTQYSDPFIGLDGSQDEDAVRIQEVLARGAGAIRYTYDLGACWEHEITLELTRARDPGQNYPVCVAYGEDSSVEYWSEEDPVEREPFDRAEVNRQLAALSDEAR